MILYFYYCLVKLARKFWIDILHYVALRTESPATTQGGTTPTIHYPIIKGLAEYVCHFQTFNSSSNLFKEMFGRLFNLIGRHIKFFLMMFSRT